MDPMDVVDSTESHHQPKSSSSSSSSSSSPSQNVSAHPPPSHPVPIIPPTTSRFKPAPATRNMHSRPDHHKSAFTPFAPSPVSNIYSHNMFKPLSNPSSTNTNTHPVFSPQPNNPVPLSQSPIHTSHTNNNILPLHTTSFKPNPSAPVQIPRQTSTQKPSIHPQSNPLNPRSLGSAAQSFRPLNFSPHVPIPQSLPSIPPSYPATLFGGLSADDEHVTVWEPATGKTVAGNAAPYRRNLAHWLECHPGWEVKSDELKSSKRRSAARRGRSAADSFAALCHYPVATFLANDAAQRLNSLGDVDHLTEETMMHWGTDDFVRLQEAIFRLGQECHRHAFHLDKIDKDRWTTVCAQVGASKLEGTVLACAHHMLTRGIAKSRKELRNTALPSSFGAIPSPAADAAGIGSPASLNSYDAAMPNGFELAGPSSLPGLTGSSGALLLEKSFKSQREPRVTVWNPTNGRTISGNAAPCKRNLEAWMRQHPGWVPKEEGQLSSSRRNRNRKIRPSSVPSAAGAVPSSVEPESPHFNDALQGLLFLSRSPTAYSPSDTGADDTEMAEDPGSAEGQAGSAVNSVASKKNGMISSVSSSSAEDGNEVEADDAEEDEVASKRMEL